MNTSKIMQNGSPGTTGVPVDLTGPVSVRFSDGEVESGHCTGDTLVLGKAIDALPELERLVLSLHYCEGLNPGEIGVVLDLKESKVLGILGRVLGTLRKRFPLS